MVRDTKKILVGEDSSIIINLTKSVLAFENYSMKAARNGKQVLEMLAAEDFDLILMDLQMPVMGGMDATRHIRKQARFQDLPIVALSASGDDDELERWKSEGITDHLVKPFDSERLWSVVQRHLSAKKVDSPN